MHNHDGKNNKSMMWMMIPCLLLIAFALFGGGKLASSNYLWLIMLGVCVVPHLWMMFKGGHGGHNDDNTENKTDNIQMKNNDDKSKHSDGCH